MFHKVRELLSLRFLRTFQAESQQANRPLKS